MTGAPAGTSRAGWSAAPQVSRTQWTGQTPPSAAKWGVCCGCQSWLYATSAPFALARAASRLTIGMMSAPPRTLRLPEGSAKSFWTSTTISATPGR